MVFAWQPMTAEECDEVSSAPIGDERVTAMDALPLLNHPVSILDLEMPKAIVLRQLKQSVGNRKPFQKEAKLALTRAVTVFISYLTVLYAAILS
jgi:hypothetical protein